MFKFAEYLIEAAKKVKKQGDFKPGDAAGKLFELLKGREHNGGKFPDSYRVEGKTPENIHDKTAKILFGDQYKDHPVYKNMVDAAKTSSEMTERWVAGRHQHDRTKGFNRFVWTSQPSDPEKFLGSKPEKPVGDNMAELSHGGNHAFSEKVTDIGSHINYANPGVQNFERMTGRKLSQHNEPYAKVLTKHGIRGAAGTDFLKKIIPGRRQTDYVNTPKEQKIADEINAAYNERNKSYGRDMRDAFSDMAEKDKKDGGTRLRDAIFNAVTPSRETPTTVTHTELNSDGTHHRTRVYDLHEHINQYLDQFHGLHIQPNEKDPASVTIHGIHKKTGEVMPISRMAVYSSDKSQISPRGSMTLPSENHKNVQYLNELDTSGKHGNSMDQYSLNSSAQRPTARVRVSQKDFPDKPKPTKPKRAAKPKVAAAPKPTKPKRVKPFKEVIAPAPVVRPQRRQRVRTPISSAPVAAAPSTQSLLNRPRPGVKKLLTQSSAAGYHVGQIGNKSVEEKV